MCRDYGNVNVDLVESCLFATGGTLHDTSSNCGCSAGVGSRRRGLSFKEKSS